MSSVIRTEQRNGVPSLRPDVLEPVCIPTAIPVDQVNGHEVVPAAHRIFEPRHLQFKPAWYGLSAAGASLSVASMWRFGWPAALGTGLLGLLSLAYMTMAEPRRPVLERVTLRLPTLPAELDGLRVGQITDIHLGMPHSRRNLDWAVAQMKHEQPDLLVLTGDLVSFRRAIPDVAARLRTLSAPLGVYAVPGNHDHWEGVRDLQAALAVHNIPMLLNEHRRLCWKGADLWLAGVDDIWSGQPDLAAALRGTPEKAFILLLAHSPDTADEAAGKGVALQLSGHTHGGQLRLPVAGPCTLPRFGRRYVMGSYQIGDLQLYVSRGLGGAPLRLLCRPEATIFTLRRGD